MKIDAYHIYKYISQNSDGKEWACINELNNGTGSSGGQNYIDAWRVNLWPSREVFQAFEIKVSKSDFINELRNPDKRKFALSISNQFYFATAPNVVTNIDLIPPECGWIEYRSANGEITAETKKEAPWRDIAAPTWNIVRAMLRRSNDYSIQRFTSEISQKLKNIEETVCHEHWEILDRVKEFTEELYSAGEVEIANKIRGCFSGDAHFLFDRTNKTED